MRRIFIARHPAEAHFVMGLLEAEGIAAEVRGEALFGALGEVPLTMDTLPSVWILNDTQAERALEMIRAYERHEFPAHVRGPVWRCPNCGELIEPQFTACWQCGTNRPSSP